MRYSNKANSRPEHTGEHRKSKARGDMIGRGQAIGGGWNLASYKGSVEELFAILIWNLSESQPLTFHGREGQTES